MMACDFGSDPGDPVIFGCGCLLLAMLVAIVVAILWRDFA